MSIEIIAGVTAIIAAIGILYARTFTPAEKSKTQAGQLGQPRKNELFSKLLLKSQGDHGKANRLIEFERRRTPTASESELIKAAIERIEWDIGR